MEASTTIKQMLAGNRIFVPTYQRAYSWDTEFESSKPPKQVNTFLSDLEDYNRSTTKSKYYFGHFLFEEREATIFGVIDGQQRMTTIVIFLSALFSQLKKFRPEQKLKENEQETFEDIIKRNSTYRFSTVAYDNQLFKDYVIDQSKKDKNGLETESAKRIVNAFDFFTQKLKTKDETYLLKMLDSIQSASCTTHPVTDESEAIQMFIFQNNRGKKPSNLEIIKAQFMFNVHLYGGEEKESLIEEIKTRFEKIYKSISAIEYNINEDDVLVYTLRVHFNSLWESNAIEKINKLLSEENSISFIKDFTYSLAVSFEHLTTFFGKDERENLEIHSLVSLGGIGIAMPFIIKAYKFGLPKNQINQLSSKLESMVLRHRLIGTRADITSRLNDVFQKFTSENTDTKPIVDKIDWMKTAQDWWWAYWNNIELEKALQGGINHSTAKFLLWKYENHLESKGKSGYSPTRFDKIINPELEHIAPQTENPETGYDTYDEEFINEHINCLGNYLLLSKSHNCSVGNKPFSDKRVSYTHLEQQREIKEMTNGNPTWTRDLIQKRKDKIIQFLMRTS
ncbi:MAG: DUF262 domain-containing protein [Bacteroidetes bacterium]|nr:DUF262 domain-containing protein [Bacteroidota bacterium]